MSPVGLPILNVGLRDKAPPEPLPFDSLEIRQLRHPLTDVCVEEFPRTPAQFVVARVIGSEPGEFDLTADELGAGLAGGAAVFVKPVGVNQPVQVLVRLGDY